jgi:hypothetical protein
MKWKFNDKPNITYIDKEHFDPDVYNTDYEREGSLCKYALIDMQLSNELWVIYNNGFEVTIHGKTPRNYDFYIE